MEDPNILDMDPGCFQELKRLLANDKTRDTFLFALPVEFFDSKAMETLESIKIEPEKWLLFYLGSLGTRVSDLISWFQSANLENALLRIKVDVPLSILRQPPCKVTVQENSNLIVPCEASSFPRPEFQWFKGQTELLLQQDSELFISSIRLEDRGEYSCRISKRSTRDNAYTCLFTNSVEVIVIPDAAMLLPPKVSFPDNKSSAPLPVEQIPEIESEQNLNENNDVIPEKIVITHQPLSYAKVPQGFRFLLNCKAYSSSPIKYQWYKNRKILKGEVSSELQLDYTYPDPQTGMTRFEYCCEVSNDFEKELTTSAIIELEEPSERTQYFAEDKIVFFIANESYEAYQRLKTPAADVSDLAKLFREMDFKVFAFKNLNLIQMNAVLTIFYSMITENSYAVFFFAGHGFEYEGQTYLQPVDCSKLCIRDETICTGKISQNMQARNPALNVLLIDACRNSPQEWNEPSKIYKAHMKNNTIYGYSTCFLSNAFECEERNSFFVKHLKKLIVQDKCIQEVLIAVQEAFEGENVLKYYQNPEVKTSLSARRKLTDPLRNPSISLINSFLSNNIRTDAIDCSGGSALKCTFVIENKNMDIFFNGVSVDVYMVLEEAPDFQVLHCMEINLLFNLPGIEFAPCEGVLLKDLTLTFGSKNFLFRKEVIGIQNLKNEELNGNLVVNIQRIKKTKVMPLSIDIGSSWTNFETFETENVISEYI